MDIPIINNSNNNYAIKRAINNLLLSDTRLIYTIAQNISNWEISYKFITDDTEDKPFYWIENLKGVKFDTLEDAKLYAFLNWCERNSEHIIGLILNNKKGD